MKILFVIPSLAGGGAERTVVNLSAFLSRRGHEVHVLTVMPACEDFYVLGDGILRLSLDCGGRNRGLSKITVNLAVVKRLRRLLRQIEPNVVVGMMSYSAVMSVLAARGLPCKVIITERNNPARQRISWIWAVLRKFFYGRADAIVVQTEQTKLWMKQHILGCKSKSIFVVPNAVNWPLSEYPPALKVDDVIRPDARLILTVGRLNFQKNQAVLMDAFSKIAKRHPEWMLVILGESSTAAYRMKLEQKAADTGVSERIKLPGRAGNISDWFKRSDIFVLSSRYEGFPNVLLEAMAAGCACISFDCETGPREIIRHEVDGLLVAPENVEGLAAALERLVADASLRERLSSRAIEIRERFSQERIFARWENLFLVLAAEKNLLSKT